jgi:hypothetical protein
VACLQRVRQPGSTSVADGVRPQNQPLEHAVVLQKRCGSRSPRVPKGIAADAQRRDVDAPFRNNEVRKRKRSR